jgi:hypothetical protein
MNKILEAAYEASRFVHCEHELVMLPRLQTTAAPKFDRVVCTKCETVMWLPIKPGH